MQITTIKQAEKISHALSVPSKMPGFSYSLPAQKCGVGGKLRDIEGSTCNKCYAYNKGSYSYPVVKNAQTIRYKAIKKAKWVDAMVFQINYYAAKNNRYFRWHDSGDLRDMAHLEKIIEICKQTKTTSHWLPTREYKLIRDYLASGKVFPENLTVRISSPMIDVYQIGFVKQGIPVSGVHSTPEKASGYSCPAKSQGGICGSCRACWDKNVPIVSYHKH